MSSKKGDLVRLTPLATQNFVRHKADPERTILGTVLHTAKPTTRIIRVQWPGRVTPDELHRSYVEQA